MFSNSPSEIKKQLCSHDHMTPENNIGDNHENIIKRDDVGAWVSRVQSSVEESGEFEPLNIDDDSLPLAQDPQENIKGPQTLELHPENEAEDIPLNDDLNEPHDPPLIMEEYMSFIERSVSYEWFQSRLSAILCLTMPTPNIPMAIRSTITDRIKNAGFQMGKNSSQPLLSMTFSLAWNVITFLEFQEYTKPWKVAIDRVLCLTGTSSEAQTTSLLGYMKQTWKNTYQPILDMLKLLVEAAPGSEIIIEGKIPLILGRYYP